MIELINSGPAVTVGIPSGLDPEKVRIRKAALIAAGTHPMLAEKLAVDAETQQAERDEREFAVQLKAEERASALEAERLRTQNLTGEGR